MGLWGKEGFFKGITSNVIKWWQFVFLPVLHINNNRNFQRESKPMTDYQKEDSGTPVQQSMPEEKGMPTRQIKQDRQTEPKQQAAGTEQGKEESVLSTGISEQLARQKAEQLQRDEEERRRREIEKAREKAKIASIMDANKIDVNAFIEAGKAGREAVEEEQERANEEAKKQEDIRRAEEIIARLNREAAEDEAKKQAEIEAARQKAEETFG